MPLGDQERIEWISAQTQGASPRVEATPTGVQLTTHYDVQFGIVQARLRDLLGYPVVYKSTTSQHHYISRVIPDAYPGWLRREGNTQFLFCVRAGVVPYGVPGDRKMRDGFYGTARYLTARIRALYETVDYEVLSDQDMIAKGYADADGPHDCAGGIPRRYISKVVKPVGEIVSVEIGAMKFAAGTRAGQPYMTSPGLNQSTTQVELIWREVPLDGIPSRVWNPNLTSTSAAALDDYVNKVNSVSFLNQPPACVHFLSADIRARRNPFGDRVFDVSCHYRISNGFNWHQVPVVDGGSSSFQVPPKFQYIEVTTDGVPHPEPVSAENQGVHLLRSADLADCFKPPNY